MKSPNFQFHLLGITKSMPRFIFLLLFILTNSFIYSQQLAFPTANGGGSNATGGRGQSVYHVTNLNNSGTGSFRDAVSTGNRIIVFDVSGTIELTSNLTIGVSNLTIAGQTAPVGGITICGANLIGDGANNLIMRYIRFRLNLDNYSWGGTDAVRFRDSRDVIIDHCSFSWGTDETLTFWQSTNDITIQNCIIGEGKTASIFGDSDNSSINSNLSYLRNIIYNTTHRTPNVNVDGRVDITNNLVFNWKYRLSRVSGNIELNHIGNYYSMGSLGSITNVGHQVYTSVPNNSIYTVDNILDNEGTIIIGKTDNQWNNIWQEWKQGQATTTANVAQQTGTKFTDMINPPVIIDTNVLVSTLTADCGANKTLNGDGSVTEGWDNVDTAFLAGVSAGNAISYYSESGGNDYNETSHWSAFWASVSSTPINTRSINFDTDNDGMPDSWETSTFGDLTKDGTGDDDSDGYTDLEEYLNGVDSGAPEPIAVEGVTVSPATTTLNIPESINLTATITPSNATNQSGVWTSSNDAIATVSSIGLVTSIAEGETTITFTSNDGNFSDEAIITVTNIPIPLESLIITPDSANLDVNESLLLTVEFFPSNASNISGNWTSSDESIVVVDDNGMISTISEGQAVITFTANDGGISDSINVSVVDVFFGTYEFYNADTDIMIQEITGDETFDLNIIGDQINLRSIPEGGDNNTNVESVRVEWTGAENGNWTESGPIYAGMPNGHVDSNFEPYTVIEGIYNFKVTYYSQDDGSGNVVATDNFSLTFASSSTVSAGEDQFICEGGSATLTASGSLSYVWDTGETTSNITVEPNQTTTYTVTGTDSEGNESTDSVTVTVTTMPTANAGNDEVICENDSITLNASGGDSYEWSNGQTSQSITVSPNDTTTYTVTVTTNGCSDTDDVTVTVNPMPQVNAGNDVDIYQSESITLTVNGDGTFIWNTGEETQSITVSPTETTTYTVTANLNGCSSSDSVTVTVLEPDTVNANAGEDRSICENESVTLTASGGPNYLWNTGETTQSITVSPSVTTTYSVTVFNDFNSDTDDVVVNVNPYPIASAGNERAILHGESITLSASGGSEFIWSTGETTQEIVVEPLETTTYTVEVTENGCSDTASVTVVVGVSASVGGEATICQGESTTLYAAGGSYFLWSTGETTQSIEVSPTQTTTYSVVVSNNSSSDEAEITVNVNLVPDADAGEDVTIESGQNVTLTASGGNSYLWSNGETTQNISVSPTDTTTYTVESIINGCSDSDDVKVTVVQQVNASAGQDIQICQDESTVLTATGGEFFEWNTGAETPSISVSPDESTVYTVTVSNGFSSQTAEVVVTVEDCQSENNLPQNFGNEFRVYPNPTDGQVNVTIGGVENVTSIYISDLTGKVISSETIETGNGSVINKQYDFSSFSKGIYLITFKQIGEVAITKKLIVR